MYESMQKHSSDQYGDPIMVHGYQNFFRLYKYTKKEFADAMLKKGTLRVGTLYEYKKSEAAEIGDCDEGTKGYSIFGSEKWQDAFDRIIQQDPAMAEGLKKYMPGSDYHDSNKDANMALGIINMAPDSYVFSMTKVIDTAAMEKFGYDACVEIKRPDRFFKSVCKVMGQYAWLGMLAECVYQNRWNEYDKHTDIRGDLMKGLDFSHQQEVRGLWEPPEGTRRGEDTELIAKIIEVPDARRYFRRVI